MKRVVIAGAGLAGVHCAETLRARGFEGRIVLVGAEAAAPYERPALSKEFLLGVRGTDDIRLRAPGFWDEHRIELRLGRRVVGVRPGAAAVVDGDVLPCDAFVLATGARARRLPIATPPGVHVLRTLADATALRHALADANRLVVIGGGFVGAEVASAALALGLDVAMLEAGRLPFAPLLGDEVGRVLARRYRAAGIALVTEAQVASFGVTSGGALRSVRLQEGREFDCDVALLAIGVEPVRDLATATEAGALAHICGDANGGGHWTAAAADGAEVAHRILGLDPPARQPPFFWSDQFGLRLQLVGDPRAAAAVQVEKNREGFVARYTAPDGRAVALLGANRAAEVGAFRRELALAA